MQTKSRIARIAAALAIAVVLPLALLMFVHMGKKPLAHAAFNPAGAAKVTPEQAQKITEQFGKLPMSFEPNQGQKSPAVKFYSHGPGYELFLTGQEAVMSVHHMPAALNGASLRTMRPDQRAAALRSEKISVVRMKLDGSNPDAQIAGQSQLPGKVNYFIGNDPKKWHTDIPSFASVKYSAVYPGVDLVYYGNQQQLEYDFVVAPGADPKQIAFNVDGAKNVRIDKHGDLVLKTAGGDVKFQKPFVYQEDAGQRREIAGNYVVGANHDVRFALGAYDSSKALTIDPAVLIYSTYIGGTGAGDYGYALALDSAGDAWVGGVTASTDLPPTNGITPTPTELAGGFTAGFITEVNPTGTAFLYLTYLGGNSSSSGDGVYGLAVDTSNNVYVTGFTGSANFPTPNGFLTDATAPGTVVLGGSGFLTALHPATSGNNQILYSTFLGGSGDSQPFDAGYAVATDNAGNAYVTGVTGSSDFPSKNPIVTAQNSPNGNAFITEINTTASGSASLVFSSWLGGSGGGSANVSYGDIGQAITLDAAGHTYVVGETTSTDFAPATATGSTPCGDGGFATAFVVEVDTTLTTPAPLFSYCYGGAQGDTLGLGVAIAPDKTAVVAGQTFASDFVVTPNSIPTGAPNTVSSLGFVTKFAVSGTPVVPYSTLIGGSGGDGLNAIAIDTTGNLYVGGISQSQDFPVTLGAFQFANNDQQGAGSIAKINPASTGASDIIYATYFGGAGQNDNTKIGDAVYGIAVSSANNAYVAGSTSSANSGPSPFPITPSAPQTALKNTDSNAFAAELPLTPTISVAPSPLAFGSQPVGIPTQPLYVTVTNNTPSAVTIAIPPGFTGTNAADFSYSATAGPGTACTSTVAASSVCTVGVIFTPSKIAAESATLVLQGTDLGVALTGTGTNGGSIANISPASLTFAGTLVGTISAAQTVTVTNGGNQPLVFPAGAITTAGGANFAVGSDTCSGTSVAAAGTCTFAVTLAPPTSATAGATTASVQIVNNAGNSPQTVALSGTVWDFSLSVPASQGVIKGSNTSFNVPINGLGGFTGNVGVACTSAQTNIATCAVSPSSGVPGGSVTVTVTSTGSVVPLDSPNSMPPFSIRQIVFAAIAMMLLFVIPMTRRTRTRLGLAAAMLVFAVVAGCSGSVKSRSTTLTITGTANGTSGTATHTYTTTVSVTG